MVEEGVPRPSRNHGRTLVLVRHGETDWNLTGRAQGHADISLNGTGRAQASAVAPVLAGFGPVRLWSSDLARARETAEAIAAATGLGVETDRRLREYDVGARSGLTLAEAAARYPREFATSAQVPGEETTEQVRDRIVPALRDCLDGLRAGETGIAVLHGACLKVGLMGLLGWPWELSGALTGIENGAYCVLTHDLGHDRVRLTSYNEKAVGARHGPDFVSDGPVG